MQLKVFMIVIKEQNSLYDKQQYSRKLRQTSYVMKGERKRKSE